MLTRTQNFCFQYFTVVSSNIFQLVMFIFCIPSHPLNTFIYRKLSIKIGSSSRFFRAKSMYERHAMSYEINKLRANKCRQMPER